MKTNRMIVRLLVLGALVAGCTAMAAGVPAFQGKFTLPSAIRWSVATLPAGDYSFTLDHAYPGSIITIHRGTQNVARVQVVGVSSMKSGQSEIVLNGGTVREVRLPQVGVILQYPVPGSRHRAAPLEAQIIPVAPVGAGR